MFASNNKPSRHSSRGARRDRRGRSSAAGSNVSRTRRRSADDAAGSFDRSSYVTSGAEHSRRSSSRSAGSYSADNYGSSTHRASRTPRRNAAGAVPTSPAAANSQYSRNARDDEFVRTQRAKKKKSKRKRILLTSLAVVLVLVLAGVGAAWAYVTQIDNNLRDDLDPDLLSSLSVTDSPSSPFYMLLIGVDKSQDREDSNVYGGAYRTDSMILARIDPKEKEATLISIPRDTQVTIDGHGTQKINAAYAFGGPSGAVNAVSKLAGVPISHYAEIDFDGFKAVVDALGGIDVNVPMEINDDMAGGHVDAGEQTLNGDQALILCRSRHAYDSIGDGKGDEMRAANQRMVLTAIAKKIMSSDVATMTNTVSTLADYISTDFSVTGIVGLAQSMVGIDTDNGIYTAAVPTTSEYKDNVWWEVLDTDAWNKMMDRVKQGEPPTDETVVDSATGVTLSSAGDGSSSSSSSGSSASLSGVKISVKNGSGTSGAAAQAAAKLTPDGATVETGNADDNNYSHTLVVYNNDSDKDKAQKIADLLGTGTLKQNTGTYSFSGDFLVVVGKDWK